MAWKGDPTNPAPNNIQEKSNVSEKIKGDTIASTSNRAENIRRDLDTTKDFTVTLLDIDTTILEYIDKIIDIHVLNSGDNIKVPVMYASPERWKAIQKDGVLRDGQGKFQLPIIAFSRKSFGKKQDMMSPNRHLTYPILQKYNEKNKYNPRDPLKGFIPPTHQIYAVTLPDHITLTYDFKCQTEFVEQMNTILQKINWAAEDYWGDPKRFRFRVFMGDYDIVTETPTDNDRIVKGNFSITVHAYLLEESFESRKLTTEKILTPRKIMIGTEAVMSGDDFSALGDKPQKSPFPYSYIGGSIRKDGIKFDDPAIQFLDATDISGIKAAYEKIVDFSRPPGSTPEIATIWHNPPTLSTDPGEEGWMAYNENYHFIYTNGRWLRHALSAFQPF